MDVEGEGANGRQDILSHALPLRVIMEAAEEEKEVGSVRSILRLGPSE